MRQHLLIGSMLIATLGAFYYFVVDQQVIPGQGETIAQRYEKRNAEEAARPRTRHNGTIQKPYAGCLTEAALDEAVGAAVKNDTRQLQALLVSGLCYDLMGRDYSIVETSLTTARVRVYAGGSSVVLWTLREAVRY